MAEQHYGNSGDFRSPATKPGLEIWRIEQLHAKPVDSKSYGSFYSGDCYIVLHTFDDKYGKRAMDLFFWLGDKSSQDERGGVAYKTVELDDQLGGKPVQHRETQGHESAEFLSLFPGGLRILDGGVDSAFKHVDPTAYKPRLFHLKGKRNVRVQQVELKTSSLNDGDVFILDAGLTLYQWNGSEANKYEKAKGLEMITKINSDERGAKAKLVFLDAGKDDNPDFWKVLGGKAGVKKASEVPSDDEVKESVTQLLTLDGQVLATGALERSALNTDSVLLIDSGTQVFVWVGKNAPKDQRAKSLELAGNFLKSQGRPDWTPTTRVAESGEPPAFKALFKTWEPPRVVDFKTNAAPVAPAAADTSALFKAQKAAEEKMVDNASGKLKVWRIENFDKVEVDKSMYGQFFAGDSYIVLYQYMSGSKENSIIYFWQGRNSSQDEKGTSALLTKQLFDELGGQAVQVRVVMNKEPNHFLALFKGKMVVHSGGKAGAFKNRQEADTAQASETALYHIRGTNAHNTHAVQVPAEAASLNSGDCFVLGAPGQIFAWLGKGSSDDEKKVAQNVAGVLASGREVVSLPEGSETDAFWSALGGQGEYSSSKSLESGDHEPRLFQCSNATAGASFKITEVFNFSQDDLVNDDVMLLDVFSEVYVWIGHDSNQYEREQALTAALNYVANAPDGRDPDTPVFMVNAGNEPPSFTCHFLGWDPVKASDFSDPYLKKLATVKSGPGAAGAAESKSPAAAPAAKAPAPQMVRVTSLADSGVSFLDPATNVFTAAQLRATNNLPKVDPKRKEEYLGEQEFQSIFGTSKAEFAKMPAWKKEAAKKKASLF